MKISNHISFCLFFCFLISCVQGAEKKGSEASYEGSGTEFGRIDGATDSLADIEDFDKFIRKFSDEENFQMERIKFPIKVIIPDTEHEGMAPMEETITKYEWEPIDLSYDSTFLTRQYDQYYQGVRFGKDTAVVEIRGINNGIYADYYFTLIDRKWYLVTLYEASF